MGTKRWLAGTVGSLLTKLPPGPLLDAFAGMCAVGRDAGTVRQLWTNDILGYPALVARALFTFRSGPPSTQRILNVLQDDFYSNFAALRDRFKEVLDLEDRHLSTKCPPDFLRFNASLPHVGENIALERERCSLAANPRKFPYRLFSITYAGGYFGLRQSLEIDSFRFALDIASQTNMITSEEHAWCLLALGTACTRVANSTGHFAQFLRPTLQNHRRVLAKRRRSVRSEFVDALKSLQPIGFFGWRATNKVFQTDTLTLLGHLRQSQTRPAVVFADPPYSKAQYSRYYHILETLILYDYPASQGVGRYRDGRFVTPFSLTGRVQSAIDQLIHGCAQLETTLVLSYPDNGLLFATGKKLEEILRAHYRSVRVVATSKQLHSSFGGPRAAVRSVVTERIYLAQA
jgi:adenine-specific DNA-methyltransferase